MMTLWEKYAKVSMTTDDYLYASKFADYVSDERLDKKRLYRGNDLLPLVY